MKDEEIIEAMQSILPLRGEQRRDAIARRKAEKKALASMESK